MGNFHNSVYAVPNGNKYTSLTSYDFNALYAYSMKQDLPTGLPFYYQKLENGLFKFEIAGSVQGWSLECIDWLNYMSFDARFIHPKGGFYLMVSAITGECSIEIDGHNYTIDGMVKTLKTTFFLEYLGCRHGLQHNMYT